MGLQFGLETNSFEPDSSIRGTINARTCLRQFRWLFKIDGVSASGANALPPSRAARPAVSFTESEARHLTENYSYPAKPEWKPITITLYDIVKSNAAGSRIHPVFEWLENIYVPEKDSKWYPATEKSFIKDCQLEMLSGCGDIIERWEFQNAWPQVIDFGSLDMANNEIMTCELTLKYARAFIRKTSD